MNPESKTFGRFDGGIVDGYLDTDENRYFVADNLYIDENGGLNSRDGIEIDSLKINVDYTDPQVTGVYYQAAPFTRGLFVAGKKIYSGASRTEILDFGGGPALLGKENGAYEQGTFWRGQFIVCQNGNGYTTTTSGNRAQRVFSSSSPIVANRVLQLGLPRPAATIAYTATAGANQYVYAMHWRYSFTDFQGTVFEENGPVLFYEVPITTTDPATNSITLDDLPEITLGAWNLDLTVAKLIIHRTVNFGNAYYYVGEVTNGTTTFVDSTSDTNLVAAEPIYTDGGALEWEAPPADSYYVTEVNDFFWYAGSDFVTHSIQGAAGACPSSFVQFTSEKVRGLSDIVGFPLLFCDKSVYRIEGVYDEFGNGGFDLRRISATAGCLSSRAIVKVPGGVAWPGNGGFYFSDGYSVIRISEMIPERYNSWANPNMTGAYDSARNLVYWTIATQFSPRTAVSLPILNDALVVWHMRFGIKPDSVFTTYSFDGNIFPTCLFFSESQDIADTHRSNLQIGESRGYTLYLSPLRYTDPVIVPGTTIASFTDKAVLWDFQSALDANGDPANRRYGTHVALEAGTDTDLSVQIQVRRDDTGPWVGTPEIRQDAGILWNITDALWTVPVIDYEWIAQRLAEGKRTVPYDQQRSQRRQVRFYKSYTKIYNSDTLGTATVTATSPYPTVTLLGGNIWPEDPEEYFISFVGDLYVKQYKIKERVSDTVLYLYDPLLTITPVVGSKWIISGYRKFERFQLLSYTVHYQTEGPTQTPSSITPAGSNA